MRARWLLLAWWLALTSGLTPALAHTTATGLATLDARSDKLAYRLTLDSAELGGRAAEFQRAAAGDAAALAGLAARLPELLQLQVNGKACRNQRTRVQGSAMGDQRLLLLIDFACDDAPGRLEITDRWSSVLGSHYRTLVRLTRADGTHEEFALDEDRPSVVRDFGRAAPSQLGAYVMLGIGHILGGADHLLFLAALLLGGRSMTGLLITVTAFTLAHSVSLALAVLRWVTLTPAIVEPLIAASIVWVAFENLRPGGGVPLRRYALAFGFGLVHGLAFSEVLRELDLQGWALARGLFGFNLGVELGQAAIVLAMAPLLAWAARQAAARGTSAGRSSALVWERGCSVAIGAAGLYWLVTRLIA
jgi:hypothetical protein